MVRVKNRYLVVKLLYPVAPTRPSAGDELPDLVQFHAPTPDTFHPGQLLRVVRDAVADLFGDYGVAMVNSALKGNPPHVIRPIPSPHTSSELLVGPHLHGYHPVPARAL